MFVLFRWHVVECRWHPAIEHHDNAQRTCYTSHTVALKWERFPLDLKLYSTKFSKCMQKERRMKSIYTPLREALINAFLSIACLHCFIEFEFQRILQIGAVIK